MLWLLLAAQVWASDPITSAIEQAQGLALKKDRQAAAQTLSKAIENTVPPLKGRSKLLEAQNAIARVFFTDKGQRLFELGQSAMYETPDIALAQFREAQALEDGNVLISDNVARVQMQKQDCLGALATLDKARAMFPYDGDSAVLELRGLICQKDFETFREKLKKLPPLDKTQENFVLYFEAQDYVQQKMWRKASDTLNRVVEEDGKFPEPYFFLVRTGEELNRDVEDQMRKYVSLCKVAGIRERKHYSLEPRLCSNAKDMEDELAKRASDL